MLLQAPTFLRGFGRLLCANKFPLRGWRKGDACSIGRILIRPEKRAGGLRRLSRNNPLLLLPADLLSNNFGFLPFLLLKESNYFLFFPIRRHTRHDQRQGSRLKLLILTEGSSQVVGPAFPKKQWLLGLRSFMQASSKVAFTRLSMAASAFPGSMHLGAFAQSPGAMESCSPGSSGIGCLRPVRAELAAFWLAGLPQPNE